jgi:putative addiction module antidote
MGSFKPCGNPKRALVVITWVATRREASVVSLKLRKIGNSVGVILPQATLDALRVSEGDTVYLTDAAEGYRITPYNPDFAAQMKIAQKIMKKRKNALRELAR